MEDLEATEKQRRGVEAGEEEGDDDDGGGRRKGRADHLITDEDEHAGAHSTNTAWPLPL